MKRMLSFLLCTAMLISLFACGPAGSVKTETAEGGRESGGEEDLSLLSPEALYAYGKERTERLSSFLLEGTVKKGQELDEIRIVRQRRGYDGFSYAREGESSYYFDNGTAKIQVKEGNFSAPCTATRFEAYLREYVYPVALIDPALLGDFAREGLSVSYRVTDAAVLTLFAEALGEGGAVQSVTGKARFSSEGILESETLTATGTLHGTSAEMTVSTALEPGRRDSVSLPKPHEGISFIPAEEIGSAELLSGAVSALRRLDALQGTLLTESTLQKGDAPIDSASEEVTYYAASKDEVYYTVQNVIRRGGAEESNVFYQLLSRGGKTVENRYDVMKEIKLWEEENQKKPLAFEELFLLFLPKEGSLASMSFSEGKDDYTIGFTVEEKALSEFALLFPTYFPEAAILADGIAGAAEGVFTVHKKSGLLTAFSLNFSAVGSQGELLFHRRSLTLEKTDSVTLPGLQVPQKPNDGGDHSSGH